MYSRIEKKEFSFSWIAPNPVKSVCEWPDESMRASSVWIPADDPNRCLFEQAIKRLSS